MYLYPRCTYDTIVGIVYKNKFNWYITEKEFWILNEKIEDGRHDERVGIEILDTDTFEVFEKRIERYIVSTEELREYLELANTYSTHDAFIDFLPSFYVNFDSKIFYSLYLEQRAFEWYVPDGWIGEYKDFFELIDEQYRFWIDNNGNDILINE